MSSTSKCLICFSTFQSKPSKNPEYLTSIFYTFHLLLKIDLIESMQWNFDQGDGVPFCHLCYSEVEKLKGFYDQVEFLQEQIAIILQTTKNTILNSGCDTGTVAKALPPLDRVYHFRCLVVGESACQEDIASETCYLPVDPSVVKIEPHQGDENNVELPFLDEIDNQFEFEDTVNETDPLIEVKTEVHITDESIGEEEFDLQHDVDGCGSGDSIFLDPNDISSNQAPGTSSSSVITEPDAGGSYKCWNCEKSFIRESALQLHLQYNNRCSISSQTTKHILLHPNQVQGNDKKTNNKTQTRNKRGSELNSKKELNNKIDNDTCSGYEFIGGKELMKTIGCELCEKGDVASQKFSTSHSLGCHKRKHGGEKPFKCDYCDKMFRVSKELINHRRVHTGERPYKCKFCNKTFKELSHVIKHKKIHTGERPYKCEFCDKGFSAAHDLRRHTQIHTGYKPHKCEYCDKCFGQSVSLKIHTRLHTGEMPYKCEICNKPFLTLGNLNNHRGVHSDEKPYKCDYCEKAFKRLDVLTAHNKRHRAKMSN